jgi:hypothetical protein
LVVLIVVVLWGVLVTGVDAASCLQVVEASAAGYYQGPPWYSSPGQGNYPVGVSIWNSNEVRNWFVFPLSTFPASLERAELRIYAGRVYTGDDNETYELHEITTPAISLITGSANITNAFDDLADGTVYGSVTVSPADGIPEYDYYTFGKILAIPFTAAALSKLTAAQGQQFAVGGSSTTLDAVLSTQEILFSTLFRGNPPIQLLLFFADSGAPQTQIFVPSTPSGGGASTLAGTRVSLSGAACGQQPMGLQWLKEGVPVPGATNTILEINPASVSDSGNYALRASNNFGTVVSPSVTVAVENLVITYQPQSVTVLEPYPASFYVGASSYLPISYQWRKDGVNLPGQTFPYLTLYNTSSYDTGSYDVVVSNSSGSVTSAVATLTVQLRPPVISYWGGDIDAAVGLPLTLWSTAYGSLPLSFQWLKDGQVIPGVNSNVFYKAATEFADAGNYRLIVTNFAGAVTSAVARVRIMPLLLYGPSDTYAYFGTSPRLYTTTYSSVPVSYRWFFNDTLVEDQTNGFLVIPGVDFSSVGSYYVIATNSYGAVTSSVAVLNVVTQAPTAYVYISSGSQPAYVGDDVTLWASVSGGPIPALQWQRNGVDMPGQTNYSLVLNSVTTNDIADYAIIAANIYGSVTSAPVHLQIITEGPTFVGVPGISNAVAGSIVVLRARAQGGPHPTYQWRRNGADLPGETNAMLILSHVAVEDSGLYEIVARNETASRSYIHHLEVRPATGLDRWNWRLPHPQGSRLKDIAYGNGRYVAVGKSGNIVTSPNGLDWTNAVVEVDGDLDAVAFGNGLFVTTGEIMAPIHFTTNVYFYPQQTVAVVLVSSNGVNWTVGRAPDDSLLPDITFGNGVFVAASSTYPGPFTYTSTDGLRWTPHKIGNASAYRVTWGAGKFVAISGVSFFYSPDGANWILTTNSPFGGGISALTYANGEFVALNGAGATHHSSDGIAWHENPAPNSSAQGMAGGGGYYVAALQQPVGSVLRSSEAFNWEQVDTGLAQEIEAVIYTDRFVAVGEAGTITTSTDGSTWSPNVAANRIDYYGLAQKDNMVVAAGDAGTILTSTDGRNWTMRSTPTTRNLHAVHYASGLFVAGGRRGALITSPTGVNWTSRNSGITNYIERIHWANGRWVAVGERGDFVTSTDGVTWTAGNTGAPFTDHEGVTYGNGVWVAAGGYFRDPVFENGAVSTLYRSTNGVNWTQVAFNVGVRLRDITYGNGRFVAIANDAIILVSTNSFSWFPFSLAGIAPDTDNFRRVHYANGRFVIVGNSGQILSAVVPEDPSAWISHRSHTSQNLHDVLGINDGTLLGVGNNGMFLQSGGTQPRFISIRPGGQGMIIDFDPGIVAGYVNLEGSTDLRAWETVATHVSSPAQIPVATALRFFRLTAP